jgi:fatty acid desaturase
MEVSQKRIMAYKEITDANMSAGIEAIPQWVAEVVPIFFPLMLFVFFLFVSVISYLVEKGTTGKGRMRASLAVGGYLTTLLSYVLSLIPGVVSGFVVIICLITSVLFTLLLFIPLRDS